MHVWLDGHRISVYPRQPLNCFLSLSFACYEPDLRLIEDAACTLSSCLIIVGMWFNVMLVFLQCPISRK